MRGFAIVRSGIVRMEKERVPSSGERVFYSQKWNCQGRGGNGSIF